MSYAAPGIPSPDLLLNSTKDLVLNNTIQIRDLSLAFDTDQQVSEPQLGPALE